jgi:SAM-dependent methyltransferase
MIGQRDAAESSLDPAAFDHYQHSYDEAIQRGLRLTGEPREYYARGRLRWLRQYLDREGLHAGRVLDYGCGTGTETALAQSILGTSHVTGVDVSPGLLAAARRAWNGGISFRLLEDLPDTPAFDVAISNGVFHHIPRGKRPEAAAYVLRRLRPGGIFALWENNPWNPGTRLVMQRIPFDRDAEMLSPSEGSKLLSLAGFTIRRRAFLFYFPRALALLRPIERFLTRVPLGGQYCTLATREQSA